MNVIKLYKSAFVTILPFGFLDYVTSHDASIKKLLAYCHRGADISEALVAWTILIFKSHVDSKIFRILVGLIKRLYSL